MPAARRSKLATSTPCWRNPGSTAPRFASVRTNSSAPATSTSDSAIWRDDERPAQQKPLAARPSVPRASLFRAAPGDVRVARSAGVSPKSRQVSTASPTEKPASRQLSGRSRTSVAASVLRKATSVRLSHCARTRPRLAPISGEQQALGHQLPDDARARRAEGEAHGDLRARARWRARAAGSRGWRTRSAARGRRCTSSSTSGVGVPVPQRRNAGRRRLRDQRERLDTSSRRRRRTPGDTVDSKMPGDTRLERRRGALDASTPARAGRTRRATTRRGRRASTSRGRIAQRAHSGTATSKRAADLHAVRIRPAPRPRSPAWMPSSRIVRPTTSRDAAKLALPERVAEDDRRRRAMAASSLAVDSAADRRLRRRGASKKCSLTHRPSTKRDSPVVDRSNVVVPQAKSVENPLRLPADFAPTAPRVSIASPAVELSGAAARVGGDPDLDESRPDAAPAASGAGRRRATGRSRCWRRCRARARAARPPRTTGLRRRRRAP